MRGRKASMRALEIFLQAGLLGHGILFRPVSIPIHFVREAWSGRICELADNAELWSIIFCASRRAMRLVPPKIHTRAAARVGASLS